MLQTNGPVATMVVTMTMVPEADIGTIHPATHHIRPRLEDMGCRPLWARLKEAMATAEEGILVRNNLKIELIVHSVEQWFRKDLTMWECNTKL